jgi:hypothetical protein
LELLPNLALPHLAALHVEALLVGGGDIAEHGGFLVGRAEGGPVDEVALAQVGALLVLNGPRGCFGERLGLLPGLEVGAEVGEVVEQVLRPRLRGGQLAQHLRRFRFAAVHMEKPIVTI